MADQPDNFCPTASQSAMVGMVIGGRDTRACDVCGKERARWYCAADLAYLCERCDGAVHSANAVAGRHERTRLEPNGAPLHKSRMPATVSLKREASVAVSPHPSAHFNPQKRPRSIRRHKPSSFHASKHVISSSMHASSNYISSDAFKYNNYTGSILASTHGVMIDNPRRSPDFIANINSSELMLSKADVASVKAEPYSPVSIGDQVKVPDHLDDDHILESLFDFRDLQDDDLFLHQVPVYDPLQVLSPTLNDGAEEQEYEEKEEKKPIINDIISSGAACGEANLCSNIHSPELHQAVKESKGISHEGSTDISDEPAPSLEECENGDTDMADPNTDICDLDQLDFDCVLQGNDDDSADDMNHAPSLDMDMDANSHDFIDAYPDHATTEDSTGFAEASYPIAGLTEFDASGGDSPRTWLCKVKEESTPEFEIIDVGGQHGDVCDEVLLRQKLNCHTFCADSPHTANNFKLGLKLNFEDVLSSWSDRGNFWTDGHRPSVVANCLDLLGGCFVPDINGSSSEGSDGHQLLPTLIHKSKRSDGGAREASVLRYREKRRTRLFSKKIRYEVRKLNAEKRPRMKGRFVKRMTI
ncbi:hypothetical protein GOP47_0016123 [Adiantum capillus-veneris]|uniref:Uncharacterized protein n=1 Tax=Adiantum capillus-veneris TaxID=13818 RepID=A0A9D4ULF7_ADICA|nr:hypothetical protein GOP47_0015769 [Adiantum capillus-veneris]KAI5069822.1 hypothetical protein GOP47_0016123 [Adiantum capillus-veneris]